jgi:hypothetical protein
MKTWLCVVSNRFPENYEIGIHAGTWGVEARYQGRIAEVSPGDQLIFMVAGQYRSIHQIESEPYSDDRPLWPPKDGDLFPHRVRIGPALFRGKADAKELASQISFMSVVNAWGGTIQGASGVFNGRLTDEDVELIKRHMHRAIIPASENRPAVTSPSGGAGRTSEPGKIAFQVIGKDMEQALFSLLPALGLTPVPPTSPTFDSPRSEAIRVLCKDRRGVFNVVHLHRGQAPTETLLDVLHEMSWTRQQLADGKDVKGVILAEAADASLTAMAGEVPGLSIKHYRLTIELTNGSAA